MVNATDDDLLEENNIVHYHLQAPIKGFTINPVNGIVTANRSALARPLPKEIELVVVARDSGKPPLSSTCSIIVRLGGLRSAASNKELKINVNENVTRGTTILKLADLGLLDGAILSQDDSAFEVLRGRLMVVRKLDREIKDKYVYHFIYNTKTTLFLIYY